MKKVFFSLFIVSVLTASALGQALSKNTNSEWVKIAHGAGLNNVTHVQLACPNKSADCGDEAWGREVVNMSGANQLDFLAASQIQQQAQLSAQVKIQAVNSALEGLYYRTAGSGTLVQLGVGVLANISQSIVISKANKGILEAQAKAAQMLDGTQTQFKYTITVQYWEDCASCKNGKKYIGSTSVERRLLKIEKQLAPVENQVQYLLFDPSNQNWVMIPNEDASDKFFNWLISQASEKFAKGGR